MAKPAGPRCNMRCGYCYYLGKEPGFRRHPGRMSEDFLERYIAGRLEASSTPETHFEWHGGEPTILGLDYFKRIVRIQKGLCPAGRRITNGLQTNGILLTDAWAAFLRDEGFSVGLSLDGPRDIHDRYRRTAEGGPTHGRVLRSFEILKKRGVFTNVLCVVHDANAGRPDEVYEFFRGIGVTYLQFLPLVTPVAPNAVGSDGGTTLAADGGTIPARAVGPNPLAAPPEAIGDFLSRVFDLWIAEDVGRIVVQTFDEALRPLYGVPHALCIHRETCGDAAVLERDGSFYACDHFVDQDHLIGNITERSLMSLARDPRMEAFGLAKRSTLPRYCLDCEVLESCNGGCPKDRIITAPDGIGKLSYLCPAYRAFFAHCRPELTRLAAHMKAGLSLRSFRTSGQVADPMTRPVRDNI
jgi:uncharacterized protein